MMARSLIVISSEKNRATAMAWVRKAPDGTRIEFKGPTRTLPQNDTMWAHLTDISQQLPWHGVKMLPDSWKLVFMDGLKREVRMAPNLDGTGFVNIGTSSSSLDKDEMALMITLIIAFADKHGVVLKCAPIPEEF